MRIVFMGTPDFALASLKALVENNYNVVGVVTVADKPSGRGQKLHQSPVKVYAESKGIPVLQPLKLKDENFLAELKALQPDLQIVVAFRMLPEVVWLQPPRFTLAKLPRSCSYQLGDYQWRKTNGGDNFLYR